MYTCDFVLIMIIFSQDSKTARLVFREISGVMGKVTEGFARSSARIKKVTIARERENQRNLAVVEKNLSQALKEIEEMKNVLKAKEEDNERVSTERDNFKNELEVVQENLAKETSENGKLQEEVSQMKRENGGLKENI